MKIKPFQIIIVLLVVASIWLMTTIINRGIHNALSPIREANVAVSTQIAQILHPTPTIIPDPVTIIQQVRSLARLETIQYSVQKIITAEINQGAFAFLFEDRLLLVAHGTVLAGIDLNKLKTEDVWLEGSTLMVRLPETEIFIATLNNEKTYVYERDTGILRKPVRDLETLARQSAEKEILNAALEDGILETARINGETYLARFFNLLGFSDVNFVEPE